MQSILNPNQGQNLNTVNDFPINRGPNISTHGPNAETEVKGLGMRRVQLGSKRQQSYRDSVISGHSEFPFMPLGPPNLGQGDGYHHLNQSGGTTLSVGASQVQSSNQPGHSSYTTHSVKTYTAPQNEQPTASSDDKSTKGNATSIPPRMENEHHAFGMAGLLSTLRLAVTNPDLTLLSVGCDLTEIGLNLNLAKLLPTFQGPLTGYTAGAESVDEFPVSDPPEYDFSVQQYPYPLHSKILTSSQMKIFCDEILFYLFYTYTQDVSQTLAAEELFDRGWRYHKEKQIWITRIPGTASLKCGRNWERGMYYYFDTISFVKATKEFIIEYDKVEARTFNNLI